MPDRFSILLATKSPLYAPLYIAKALNLKGFSKIDLEHFEKSPERAKESSDSLYTKVMNSNLNEKCLMVVCDPLRIINVQRNSYIEHPVILASLINRISYWFVDGNNQISNLSELKDKFSHIIVHPYGMTGYAATYYFLKDQVGLSNEQAQKILLDCNEPGKEKAYYEVLKSLTFRNHKKDFIYVTMNPFDAFDGQDASDIQKGSQFSRCFFNEYEGVWGKALMTCLITSKYHFENQRKVLDTVLEGIKLSIDLINRDINVAAQILESRDSLFNADKQWTYRQLRRFLVDVTENDIYNSANPLKIDEDLLQNSKLLWSPMDSDFEHKTSYMNVNDIDGSFQINYKSDLTLQEKTEVENNFKNRLDNFEDTYEENNNGLSTDLTHLSPFTINPQSMWGFILFSSSFFLILRNLVSLRLLPFERVNLIFLKRHFIEFPSLSYLFAILVLLQFFTICYILIKGRQLERPIKPRWAHGGAIFIAPLQVTAIIHIIGDGNFLASIGIYIGLLSLIVGRRVIKGIIRQKSSENGFRFRMNVIKSYYLKRLG